MVKKKTNLPATQETQVQSLGGEDLLEKEMTTHSSVCAWKIPWTAEPGGLWSMGLQSVGHDRATNTLYCYLNRKKKKQANFEIMISSFFFQG